MIARKLRMQGQAHQSAFTARLDVRDLVQRLWPELPVLKHAHAPGPLGKEHATIRRPHNRPDHFEIGNYGFDFEAGLRLTRGFNFSRAAAWRWMSASKRDRSQ